MVIKLYDSISRIALIRDEQHKNYLAVRMQDRRHYNKIVLTLGSDLTRAIVRYLPHCKGIPKHFIVRRKVKPIK